MKFSLATCALLSGLAIATSLVQLERVDRTDLAALETTKLPDAAETDNENVEDVVVANVASDVVPKSSYAGTRGKTGTTYVWQIGSPRTGKSGATFSWGIKQPQSYNLGPRPQNIGRPRPKSASGPRPQSVAQAPKQARPQPQAQQEKAPAAKAASEPKPKKAPVPKVEEEEEAEE